MRRECVHRESFRSAPFVISFFSWDVRVLKKEGKQCEVFAFNHRNLLKMYADEKASIKFVASVIQSRFAEKWTFRFVSSVFSNLFSNWSMKIIKIELKRGWRWRNRQKKEEFRRKMWKLIEGKCFNLGGKSLSVHLFWKLFGFQESDFFYAYLEVKLNWYAKLKRTWNSYIGF